MCNPVARMSDQSSDAVVADDVSKAVGIVEPVPAAVARTIDCPFNDSINIEKI